MSKIQRTESTVLFSWNNHLYLEIRHYLKITVGSVYKVRWGKANHVDEAVVVEMGTYDEMKTRMLELKDNTSPESFPAPSPEPQPRPPPQKRQKTKSGRSAARVLERLMVEEPAGGEIQVPSHPPPMQPDDNGAAETPAPELRTTTPPAVGEIHVAIPLPPMQADDAGDADTPAAVVATPTPVVAETELAPRTPDHHNTPRFRSVRPGDGMVISTLNQLVGMVRSLQGENRQLRQLVQVIHRQANELNGEVAAMRRDLTAMCSSARAVATVPRADTPTTTPLPDVGISEEEVRQIFRRSNNPGLFAAHLTQRLFPELFTDANLRHHYNFYGGGTLNKQQLSPTRRDVVRRQTVRHYPEVVSEGAFKAQCVSKVNELLRRPVRKPSVQDVPMSMDINLCQSTSFSALLDYTNL